MSGRRHPESQQLDAVEEDEAQKTTDHETGKVCRSERCELWMTLCSLGCVSRAVAGGAETLEEAVAELLHLGENCESTDPEARLTPGTGDPTRV